MSRQRTAENVPDSQVPALRAVWEAEGATVVVKDNGNGTSNVTGTWPDSSGASGKAHGGASS